MPTIHQGDALTVLRTLPDGSVHCCVTSPPYWGLRDYGTAQWEGGDPACVHRRKNIRPDHSGRTITGRGGVQASVVSSATPYRDTCGICSAVRVDAQIGLEPTPGEYVGRLVEVFREVRRVLRSDGTLWMNMGDSYAAQPGQRKDTDKAGPKQNTNRGSWAIGSRSCDRLKPKDLCGIPWRLAFALQEDGWWLRSDIIWSKPNPMPESVIDRPTKAHEYIFLLSKSVKYYYDGDAIKEATTDAEYRTKGKVRPETSQYQAMCPDGIQRKSLHLHNQPGGRGWRNKRSVWTVPTQPTPEAHFATYPIALIEPCILAGCPPGGVVLDPFAGAGTTMLAALKHGRDAVLIELNPQYVEMMRERAAQRMPLFAQGLTVEASA